MKTAQSCFEVVTAFEGFSVLEKRSETLNGSVPLRAAQGCKPLLDGNAAGFHLRLILSAVIRKDRGRAARLIFTDGDEVRARTGYRAALDRIVDHGLLPKSAFWHRTLRNGPAWQTKDTLYIWSGLLIRSAPESWVLVSGAFNRRCFVKIREYVIAESNAFVPLILEIDLPSLRDRDTWLDTELACLLPLSPGVEMSIVPLRDRPEIGRAWSAFYDSNYVEPRIEGKYVGRYRKITANEPTGEEAGTAYCQLVVPNGPRLHRVRRFNRFATGTGWSKRDAKNRELQYAVIRNLGEVAGRWDGLSFRDVTMKVPDAATQLLKTWTELYGDTAADRLEHLFEYIVIPTPHRGEPVFGIVPRAFAATPPGWSSVVDAYDRPGLDGMRGVISTDSYFGTGTFWQLCKPMRFAFPRGADIIRVLPVPRRLLRSDFSERALDRATIDRES